MSNRAPGGLFVVSAPSGGGKTSLTRASIEQLGKAGITAEISVSYTTRAPRPGEQEGVHYHFVEPDVFKSMIARGEFLEHAEIYGQHYGTARTRTAAIRAQGRDVILDIDWQGARQIRQQAADAIGIFILPPSITKLEQRLRARKQDSEEAIASRMEQARAEMAHYAEYDYVVVNRDFEQAMAELVAIFIARRLRRSDQEVRHKALIHKLLS
ncbi:MAG TPA: guanylate kinase [Planctomycetota bacterium]|nr:guanylate kinase [Planctomycetota bacterium]